jgi:hypothetical protein
MLTILCIVLFCVATNAQDIPKLVRNKNGAAHLLVKDKPFMMLGGELMNSSGSTLEDMALRWKNLKSLNLNTIFVAAAWQQIEPEEGKFNFTVVEGLIKQARKNKIKLVFLWFGSWKNGYSGYAPEWVLRDLKRFPRMQTAKGENRPILSPLSEELNKADAKAYTALMTFIKKVDSRENTVLMMQIENEVGSRNDSRDRSPEAERKFNSNVPSDLMTYIQQKEKQLWPEISKRWNENGRKLEGTWPEIFGKNDLADELFMACHYATFINEISVSGKQVYPISTYVNAWAISPEKATPGVYPSGGPNHRMLDVYQAVAPSIDLIAVDNYQKDYKRMTHLFHRNGNPVFIPEAVPMWEGDYMSGPSKAFYTYGEFNTICFSPFSIDHPAYNENHPLAKAYETLNNLMPLILKEQGTGKMRGFMQQDSVKQERIDFKDYYINVRYPQNYTGYGLVIQLSDDEFLLSGNGFNAQFFSKNKLLSGLSYGLIKEGHFVNGEWKTTRFLGGDEASQGVGGLKLPVAFTKELATPNSITTVRVKVIPIPGSTVENADAVN